MSLIRTLLKFTGQIHSPHPYIIYFEDIFSYYPHGYY